MDVIDFARFPFLTGALKYVEALDFKLEELFYERAFEQIRMRGKERVVESIGEGISRPDFNDGIGAQKELLSYPVARILVSCINDGYLIKRYALAEAKSASEQIKKLPDDALKELAHEFNMAAEIKERAYVMHFTDYIRYASAIHEHQWKLVNRKMNHGRVHLTKEEISRLIEEAVRKRIESGLPLDVPQDICTSLEGHIGEIRESLSARKSRFNIEELKEIMPDCFPPCMKYALANAQSGINLSHSMRFALTSFLLNIGMSADRIIELFKVSPDFDEEKTRYQVQHIHGSTGTVYTSPSCSTMITYGNCYGKEPLCERISHPLSYYRKKAWILKKTYIQNDPNKR